MKKLFFVSILFFFSILSFTQSTWYPLSQRNPSEFRASLVSSSGGESVVEFTLPGFYMHDVPAPRSQSKVIRVPRTAPIAEKGAPDMVLLTAPLIIPDLANMEIVVLEAEYQDIFNIEVAPSKGNFSRQIDPSTVPFEYGPMYQQDQWYPGKIAELAPPHIHRDYRGTVAMVYPFQYNPVRKILRVYSRIVVHVKKSNSTEPPVNPLYRTRPVTSIVEDFDFLYQQRYLNYVQHKYNAPVERGRILVITHPNFLDAIMPYVRWKNIIGFPAEVVTTTTTGSTATAIKNYVVNYYNTKGLAYLLLVGDHTEVPTYSYGAAPGGLGTMYSDNYYGDILGNDMYLEVIVGRFSATTTSHVQTQVTRTIEYEKGLMTNGWQRTGMGIAHNEGAGGGHDGGEADYVHMDNIRQRLLNYNYTTVYQDYTSVSGIPNTTRAQISSRINNGVTIINYCNHGNETGWSVPATEGGYTVTQVNDLTNVRKLPFIWSVACLVGNFTRSGGDCFAEAWLKATHNTTGEPTGAIAFFGSTISQPWIPPMDAQDEFNRVLCEHFPNKIRRTYGTISACGVMYMLDLGPTDSYRLATARTWTIFGDPSIMVRTYTLLNMTVQHPTQLNSGTTSMIVNCNAEGAFVTLTKNYEIIGTGTITNGTATITFPAVNTGDTIHIAVTKYNYVPYENDIPVVSPQFSLDMMALSIAGMQQNYQCPEILISPKVVIRNNGTSIVTSCRVYYRLDNNSEQMYQWTGSLQTNQVDTVVLPSFYTTVGNHVFRARVAMPNGGNDQNVSNDTTYHQFTVLSNYPQASFSATPTQTCSAPASVTFTNNSVNAQSYTWFFGDGNISNVQNPVHQYDNYGIYDVTLIADGGACGKDTLIQNSYIQIGAAFPVVQGTTICSGEQATLTASGQGNINWYADPQGTQLLASGNVYVTPPLNSDQSFWVQQEQINISYGGKPDNSGVGGYYTSASVHGLIFNCTKPVILKSVKVYFGGTTAANRTFRLEDSNGNLIQDVTVLVQPGENRVTLNLPIPAGNDLRLMGPTAPNLFRNGSMTLNYPYQVGSAITITRSTAGNGYEYNYYYYFYDWEVSETCLSGFVEVPVDVIQLPVSGFSFEVYGNTVTFTNTSSGDNLSYLWNFGDGNTSNEQHPVHQYATGGQYTVVLTVSNACGSDTEQHTLNLTTTDEDNYAFDAVIIYPNPAKEFLHVMSSHDMTKLEVYDNMGKVIYQIKSVAKEVVIPVSSFAQGAYLLRIITSQDVFTRTFTIH